MTLADVASEIIKSDKQQKPILIGIEGFGGSGKTTIAHKLKESLQDAYIIGVDDFIIKDKLTDKSPDKVGFDRNRLEEQVLIPASSGKPVAYQQLIWFENKLSEPVNVPETKYLIVEGISSYHPDLAEYYDYKIWVNTPIETAKQRGKLKDAGNENEKYWDVWAKNDLAYQHKYHPEQRADFIVDNTKNE